MKGIELGRPVAASLIFVALLSLGGLTLAVSWADLSTAESERDAKTDFVSRSMQASRRADGTLAGSDAKDLFVSATTESLAAAEVDALVRTLAREREATVLSSRAEAKHDEAGLAGRIEVQAVIEASNDALQALLGGMESHNPMVLVDALSIQPVVNGNAEAEEIVSPKLHATVTLSAYWRGVQK